MSPVLPPHCGVSYPLLPSVLNHRDPDLAAAICQVLQLAYAQEAIWLGAQQTAPLQKTAANVQASNDFHLGVQQQDQLLGVLSIGPDDEEQQLCIKLLVVHPSAQRQGVGRCLVQAALQRGAGMPFAVATGANNAAAMALYQEFGFVVYRHGTVGPKELPLVKLRRPAMT